MSRTVEIDETTDELVVRFRFDQRLKDFVKSLPGSRFDWNRKVWRIPAQNAPVVIGPLREQGFTLPAELVEVPDTDVVNGTESVTEAEGVGVRELNHRVAGALLDHFSMPIWVIGELDGYDRSRRYQHAFFDLVERAPNGQPMAQVRAVMFQTVRERVERLCAQAGLSLEDGARVRVRARVELYVPRGTYQLVVDDLDVAFLAGELVLRREEILASLRRDGLLDKNRGLAMPSVPLRVALVTSADSDAYHDVLSSLRQSGFGFEVTLFGVRVQGNELETTVRNALTLLAGHADLFDVCVITRGGGSRVELSGWDNERIARDVAHLPIKVIVAIGHEMDRSVLDELAESARTPTEAGRLLGGIMQASEDRVRWVAERLESVGTRRLATERTLLEARLRRLHGTVTRTLHSERSWLDALPVRLRRRVEDRLRLESRNVDRAEARLAPERVRSRLEREDLRLGVASRRLASSVSRTLAQHKSRLNDRTSGLRRSAALQLDNENSRIGAAERMVRLADPRRVVERGYAILRDESGRVRTRASELTAGADVVAELRDGRVRLVVKETESQED